LPASVASQYSNYTTTGLPVPDLITGSTVPFSLTLTDCTASVAWTNTASIYIDYNRNCTFEPAELVYNKPSGTITYPQTFGGNITIPSSASPGRTLCRVVFFEGASPATGTNFAGETEDYVVNIIAAPLYPISTFAWTPQPTTPSTGKIVTASPTANTCYTLTATNSVGCTAISITCVTLGPVSCGAIVAAKDSVCGDGNDTLSGTPLLGGTPYTFAWTGSGIVGATNTQTIIIAPTNNTAGFITNTYTLVITDACGTTCSSTKNIVVRPRPVVTIASSLGTNGICVTGSAVLTATSALATSFAWAGPATLSATTGAVVTVTPNTTPTNIYTVTTV
jgi:hypothetical protein